jgi:hypothetical protein
MVDTGAQNSFVGRYCGSRPRIWIGVTIVFLSFMSHTFIRYARSLGEDTETVFHCSYGHTISLDGYIRTVTDQASGNFVRDVQDVHKFALIGTAIKQYGRRPVNIQ